MDGIVPNGNHHLGHGNNQRPGLHLHPHLLPGKNGAQTRRVIVPIGSQLIGTAQLEHTWLKYGSHLILGNEGIFTDPLKCIQDDENNVCL